MATPGRSDRRLCRAKRGMVAVAAAGLAMLVAACGTADNGGVIGPGGSGPASHAPPGVPSTASTLPSAP